MPQSIDAHIASVARKQPGGAWFRVETDDPTIKWLDTNDDGLAQEAMKFALDGTFLRIEFNERDSKTINERTGKPYRDRYLVSLSPLAEGAAQQQQRLEIPVAEPQTRSKTDPDDAWRMSLAKGAEIAARLYPFLPPEQQNFPSLTRAARLWGEFFYFSERPQFPTPTSNGEAAMRHAQHSAMTPSQPVTVPSHRGAYDEPLGYDPPPHGDDDIPF
jgi:hypothetical protein